MQNTVTVKGFVKEVDMSVEEARLYFDSANGALPEDVELAIDEAQGEIHSGTASEAYVILKITKD